MATVAESSENLFGALHDDLDMNISKWLLIPQK